MKGLTRDRKKRDAHSLICSRCGLSGGTLVKIDDHYEHPDLKGCERIRLKRKEEEDGTSK